MFAGCVMSRGSSPQHTILLGGGVGPSGLGYAFSKVSWHMWHVISALLRLRSSSEQDPCSAIIGDYDFRSPYGVWASSLHLKTGPPTADRAATIIKVFCRRQGWNLTSPPPPTPL